MLDLKVHQNMLTFSAITTKALPALSATLIYDLYSMRGCFPALLPFLPWEMLNGRRSVQHSSLTAS